MPLNKMSFNQLLNLFRVLRSRADSIDVRDCRFKYYYGKAVRVSEQVRQLDNALRSARIPVGTYAEHTSSPENLT